MWEVTSVLWIMVVYPSLYEPIYFLRYTLLIFAIVWLATGVWRCLPMNLKIHELRLKVGDVW
jgi:hypothetical protein